MSSSKQSSNLFGLVSSLLIILVFIIKELQARELCYPSSCGDIRNISYPFRLRGDAPGCGNKDYELSCQNDQTILEFNSGRYLVKKVWYDQRKITVVDYNLANGSCSLPYKALSYSTGDLDIRYDIAEFYDYTAKTNAHFVRCLGEISNFTYVPLPCLNQNGSYAYVRLGGSTIFDISDLPNSCWFVSTVPTNVHSHQYMMSQKSLQLLGFNLTWSVKCKDCRLARGFCRMKSHSNYCGTTDQHFAVDLVITILMVVANFLLRIISVPLGFLYSYLWLYMSPLSIINDLLWGVGSYPTWTWLSEILNVFYSFPDWLCTKINLIIYGNQQPEMPLFDFFPVCALTHLIFTRFIFSIAIVGFVIHKYRTTRETIDMVEKFLYNQRSIMPRRYHYAEIMTITSHFSYKLGQGGFGSVFKGQLFDGTLVAVKVLGNSKFNGEEFISEVSTIGRIHHSNVVRLLGFCSERSKRVLIYEYMPNGSLDKYIFSKKDGQTFKWEKLHQIALGTARGIEYLHNGCDVCILHFDIKPHNILLDANFNPKVADFGLAKFHPKENNFICVTAARGTIGYIAPELISRNFGAISCWSDVYSFGMLLLEMAGGRRNSFAMATRSSKAYFPSWVYDRIIKGRELEFQNASEIEEEIARKLCIVGLWCIQVNPTARPTISKVVDMLEGRVVDVQMPPKPFFSALSERNSTEEIEIDPSKELFEYSQSFETS